MRRLMRYIKISRANYRDEWSVAGRRIRVYYDFAENLYVEHHRDGNMILVQCDTVFDVYRNRSYGFTALSATEELSARRYNQ